MIMNHDLAGILERSEINYMIDRMTAIQEREGNPEGIVINEFGLCTAFYSRRMPWGLFNNVKGLIEEEVLEDVLRFYEERERKFEIQIIPSKVNQDVLKLLSQRGFYQSGFHTTLYCDSLAINSTQKEEIHIRELQEDEFDIYAEIHCLGTGLSLEGKSYVAANNEVLYARRGWKYYIGFYNDIPAAVA
ncbi:GCN5 family acetyltransferase, partial [Paenibacillus macquariensis]